MIFAFEWVTIPFEGCFCLSEKGDIGCSSRRIGYLESYINES
jgi:hypothetical protein